MKIVEESNLKVKKIPMNADYQLANNIKKPLNKFCCGSLMCISGPSGSGKTNLLINLLNRNPDPDTKERQSFKGLFHNIFLVSPSLHTLKNNIFEDLDTTYDTFDEQFLDDYDALIEEQKEEQLLEKAEAKGVNGESPHEEPYKNLIVLDDCGDAIKGDKILERRFIKLINNRRHHGNTSIIVLCQNIIQLPRAIRKNMNFLICFNMKSLAEEEEIFSYTKLSKKRMREFYDFIFDLPHQFLFIDMTLKSGRFEFYKNFDKMSLE